MMLPGVELARRRRVHHAHEVYDTRVTHDLTASRRTPSILTAMDESAVNARRRIDEKLRRFSAPPLPAAASSSSKSSPSSNLIPSRAKKERQLNDAVANNTILTMDDISNKKPGRIKITEKKILNEEICVMSHGSQSKCEPCRIVVAL